MKKRLVLIPVLLVLAALLASAGCSEQGLTVDKGRLKMCGNENIGFLEYYEADELGGFSAELAEAIADRLDLELDVQLLPFTDLLSRLSAGKCDIVMSAVTITPEREQQMEFSEPYFDSGQCILVKKDSAIKAEEDLRGKKVGVNTGTTNQEMAEKIAGIGEIVGFEGKPEMFDALIDGKVDAVIVDTPFALYNVNSTGKTRIAKELTSGEHYGIALKKGNTKLLDEVNTAMDEIRKDGTFDRLYEEYFGKES